MPRQGTEPVNVPLLKKIIRLDNVTHERVRERAGWGSTINLRRALDGNPVTKRIFEELAGALSVNPAHLLLAGSGATYEDVLRGRGENPPPSSPTVYRGPAELHELHVLDDFGRVEELTTRRCYYKIEDATLTIDGTEVHLIIKKVTMYDDPSCSKERSPSHSLEGRGPYVRGSASIQYTVKDQTGQRLWAGACVLNSLPHTQKFHGYWMSAGQKERGRTVLGTLELDPESVVRKPSEEAGGHDQREG
jgi:hypothetical protein